MKDKIGVFINDSLLGNLKIKLSVLKISVASQYRLILNLLNMPTDGKMIREKL